MLIQQRKLSLSKKHFSVKSSLKLVYQCQYFRIKSLFCEMMLVGCWGCIYS